MHIKNIIIIITIFLIYDTYYENKYINQFKTYTKYYKMIGIAIFGIGSYVLINNGTKQSNLKIIENFINLVPIDKQSKSLIKPFIQDKEITSINRMNNSGKINNNRTCKRSVSETKKKYVASQQEWKCGECNEKLPAWFEVDHIKRLDRGGSNEINNLVALCRNCHGKKTAMENML